MHDLVTAAKAQERLGLGDWRPMIRAMSTSEYAVRPRAISVPSGPMTLTVSPRSKRPREATTPVGRRLLPSWSARTAPASMMSAPAGRRVPAIHCLRKAVVSRQDKTSCNVRRFDSSYGMQLAPQRDAHVTSSADSNFAAASFVAIPPRADVRSRAATHRSISGVMHESPG